MPVIHSNDPALRADVEKGLQWLHDWYAARKTVTDPSGLLLLSKDDIEQAMQKLGNTPFFTDTSAFEQIAEGILDGTYGHPPQWTPEKTVDVLASTVEIFREQKALGVTLHLGAVEPVVLHGELEKGNGLPMKNWFPSTTVHEGTHVLNLREQEDRIAVIIGTGPDGYTDKPKEVYARLNEMRFTFGLDPRKTYTVEDVQTLRESVTHEVQTLKKEYKSVPYEMLVHGFHEPSQRVDMLKDRIDKDLFSRYTDDQICRMLNEVACVESSGRDLQELDILHEGNGRFSPEGNNGMRASSEPLNAPNRVQTEEEKTVRHQGYRV